MYEDQQANTLHYFTFSVLASSTTIEDEPPPGTYRLSETEGGVDISDFAALMNSEKRAFLWMVGFLSVL